MKILLSASFNRLSGYGNDGVDIARWLDKLGADVHLNPRGMSPPLPMDVLQLMTKQPMKVGYDFSLQFAPPFQISVRDSFVKGRQGGMPSIAADRHVGWSMWEQSLLDPKDMTGHSLGSHPWRLLDRMYVTWKGCEDAFRFYDDRPEYRTLPCGIDPELFPYRRRSVTGPTRFFMAGDLNMRKGPFIAVEAFSRLKDLHGDKFDAELHLKSSRARIHPKVAETYPGVVVMTGVWPWEKLLDYMLDMTCYVGPSLGEGNLKPPMEFMATGGTVIVTNWSGPTNWLHPDVSYPLNYELEPVVPGSPALQARPSVEHLMELMWRVHTNRAEAALKGEHAANWIRQVASWERIVEKLLSELENW